MSTDVDRYRPSKFDRNRQLSTYIDTEIDIFRHISTEIATEIDIFRHISTYIDTEIDIFRHISTQKSTFFDIYRQISTKIGTDIDIFRHISTNIGKYRPSMSPKKCRCSRWGDLFKEFFGGETTKFLEISHKPVKFRPSISKKLYFQSIFHPFMPILWPKRVPKIVFLSF